MNSMDKNASKALNDEDLEQISGGAGSVRMEPCICPACKKKMMGVIGAFCPYCRKSKLFPAIG